MSEPGSGVFADATQVTGDVIIELDHVDKWFGEFQALRDINLRVARKEVVVVIGPSGSGKSTMIRCINRLEEHDAGRIVVDGVELSTASSCRTTCATSRRSGARPGWCSSPSTCSRT